MENLVNYANKNYMVDLTDACWNNKDHQKMMVDPMFMIAYILRSFITSVTPTAVAPIAVILPVFN